MLKRWYGLAGGLVIALAVLMVVLAAPPTPTQAQSQRQSTEWRCVEINGTLALNIRSGPGVAYNVVITRPAGTQMAADYAAMTSADGYNWLPVRPLDASPDDFPNGEGWAITMRLTPCPVTDTDTETNANTPHHDDQDTINQDGILDRFEIAQIAHSVVLIANVQGSRIEATGTGTITTPDGLIVTNAHVVADADRVAVGILGDINDPPEYLYLGEIVSIDEEIDVALIAIRYDMDEHPINAADLELPYVPATLNPADVFRGDAIYIFGYPGIGDDFLVVTTGSIVSVENGDLNGQRLPIWYRTDAELAPGNSGGLAVNGNGEFVGIPTFVQTEYETGGRLGGIRPAEVALMAVLDEQYGPVDTVSEGDQNAETELQPETVVLDAEVYLQDVQLEHAAIQNGEAGIAFTLAFTIIDWQDQEATISARVFHDDLAGLPVINLNAPDQYRDTAGVVMTSVPLMPCCYKTIYDDVPLFLPYAALGLTDAGTYPLKIEIAVTAGDGAWRRVLYWEFVTYTRK
ncbi:MAG: trypsin-like peptidase domain-containing protein [Anaerolineae bacterium]|nr:trypsin-like peptidase domain-containing protein [Anaerolineae bacterium]